MMLEITEPARRLIRDAWRRGLVLVVSAPWRGYAWTGSLFAAWRRAGDDADLSGCIRIGGDEAVYLRADLLPDLRRRRLLLEPHSVFGLWRGISVRELEPAAIPLDDGLWPRRRRDA